MLLFPQKFTVLFDSFVARFRLKVDKFHADKSLRKSTFEWYPNPKVHI